MLTMDEARIRAAGGAEWLDNECPGWDQRIELQRMRMELCGSCILGQLFGNFHTVVQSWRWTFDETVQYGFALSGDDWHESAVILDPVCRVMDAYGQLGAAWTEIIQSRLAMQPAVKDTVGENWCVRQVARTAKDIQELPAWLRQRT